MEKILIAGSEGLQISFIAEIITYKKYFYETLKLRV